MSSVNSRHRTIDERPEWTASISTQSIRTAGGSGSTTRVTTKCFSWLAGETAVHLLSKSFFGLSGFFRGSTIGVEWAAGWSGAVMGTMIPLAVDHHRRAVLREARQVGVVQNDMLHRSVQVFHEYEISVTAITAQ